MRPAEGAEGPEGAAEPGVEDVFVLFELYGLAVEFDGLLEGFAVAAGGELMVVGTVPDGDAVAPPELAADAPVADVFHPVVVVSFEAFGHDRDAAVLDGGDGCLSEGLGFHEPLGAQDRFDDGMAALAVADLVDVRFVADDEAGGVHILPEFLPGFEAVEPFVGAGGGVEGTILVGDVDEGQIVALADYVVVRVMAGRHFEGSGAELRVDVFIGDDRDLAFEDGHEGGLADEMGVAFVVGMDGDGGVAEDGLGAGRADLDVVGRVSGSVRRAQGIAECVELAFDGLVFDFEVADGALAPRAPVDEIVAAVDEVVVVETDEGF